MKDVLLRTGSVPVLPSLLSGSVPVLRLHSLLSGSPKNHTISSPKLSLHLELNRRTTIRLVSSESDVIRPVTDFSGIGSRSFSENIPEEEHVETDCDVVFRGIGSLTLSLTEREFDRSFNRDSPETETPMVELEFFGGGAGKKFISGGDGGGTGDGSYDPRKMVEYYEKMLKSNPTNALLLRNYGKYLHEVERDTDKAEVYYGRAILEDPGDGEVLSMYGKLIWETQRDEDRAKSYFDQAVHASPDDCMVLGSYAHFMWEAEDDEEEEQMGRENELKTTMVEAF